MSRTKTRASVFLSYTRTESTPVRTASASASAADDGESLFRELFFEQEAEAVGLVGRAHVADVNLLDHGGDAVSVARSCAAPYAGAKAARHKAVAKTCMHKRLISLLLLT